MSNKIVIIGEKSYIARHLSNKYNQYDLFNGYISYNNINRLDSYDVIVMCGWKGTSGPDKMNPRVQEDNIKLTKLIISYCINKSKRLILFGTTAEYIEETPYANAKREVHDMSMYLDNVTYIILGHIYGGDDNSQRFIREIFDNIRSNKNILLKTSGEQIIAPISIDEAIDKINEYIMSPSTKYTEYYVIGKEMSLNDFIKKQIEAHSSQTEVKYAQDTTI